MARQQILTPDRRLRVFVSSTLRELALERGVARDAISSLRLAPVLFEQGARPHAPRDLYAAYVAQCDVFVGIYWESYGWIAPGSEISGIEDEFDLAQGKPMLLYIREPAPEREEPLRGLISRIEEEAGSAYRTFAAAEELETLVTDDLALLLTERFHASGEAPDAQSGLPARTTSFVGRGDELGELVRLVERTDVRLVTLTGPGGIGKTRLAVEAARELAPRFADGVAYVPLDRLTDSDLVAVAIADAVGLPPLGSDPGPALARRLRDRRLLLVLDNFEHVLAAAPLVTRLLEASAELEVVATSREPLRLQGEHEYVVPPLPDAMQLFVERVRAVRPDVVWDEENMRAAREICGRVDSLPLAVEIVAAGARMLPPRVLVERLGSPLDAPSTGRRDAPTRQLSVRATIDWSYGLLGETERDLFERLGTFGGSFSIDTVGSVAGENELVVLSTLSALVDKSLVQHADSGSETRFRMLQLVMEYAAERLDDRADADEIRAMHAAYYTELVRAAHVGLRSSEQRGWKETLDFEAENLRRALSHLARSGSSEIVAELSWSLFAYWVTGPYLEGRLMLRELLTSAGELSAAARARVRILEAALSALVSDVGAAQELRAGLEWFETHDDDEGKATGFLGLGVATAPTDPDGARELIREAARLYARVGDSWAEALSLAVLGWLDAGRGDFADENLYERSYALARQVGDEVVTAHTAVNLGEQRLAAGRLEEARQGLLTALDAHEAVRIYDGLSYGLEPIARLASLEGFAEDAARLLGAADGLRAEADIPIWGSRLARFDALVSSVRDDVGDDRFAVVWREGRELGFDAALASARRVLSRTEAGGPS